METKMDPSTAEPLFPIKKETKITRNLGRIVLYPSSYCSKQGDKKLLFGNIQSDGIKITAEDGNEYPSVLSWLRIQMVINALKINHEKYDDFPAKGDLDITQEDEENWL